MESLSDEFLGLGILTEVGRSRKRDVGKSGNGWLAKKRKEPGVWFPAWERAVWKWTSKGQPRLHKAWTLDTLPNTFPEPSGEGARILDALPVSQLEWTFVC